MPLLPRSPVSARRMTCSPAWAIGRAWHEAAVRVRACLRGRGARISARGSGIRRNETPEAVAVRTPARRHPTRHHHFASVLFDQTEWLQNRTRARRAFTFQVRIQLVTMQCMGDILTEKQKAERLAEGASMSFALLFPC